VIFIEFQPPCNTLCTYEVKNNSSPTIIPTWKSQE
jgi:hypothetical protein